MTSIKPFYVALCFLTVVGGYAQQPDPAIIKMMPDIPADIVEPPKRAAYLVMHFWDKFDFKDAALMNDNLLERCFVDFIDVLSLTPDVETRDKAVQTLMRKTEAAHNVFTFVLNISERYLYELDSPVRDNEKLIPFLDYALQSTTLDEVEKIRPAFIRRNVMQNRIGQRANDFVYTRIDGLNERLYDIQADYTLLYFNDPECEDCAATTRRLIVSSVVNNLIGQGKLRIAAIYLNDDVEAWKANAKSVLHSWIYARDAEQRIATENSYDVRRTPALYLLDKDKKVILKDASVDDIEKWLYNL